ncbi:deoxynucleotidyltransferase terminal-interacting protein 2-like [Babylonia areolata]|uniref:deoxynucleotidyltransferase terminal-interacting protein 2-like n=1 Tax=Babylonia areolata TaxID=304850 RepID=UPI003FCF3A49
MDRISADSDSSSDEASDTNANMIDLADLLWHKIKKRPTETTKQAEIDSNKPSPSTSTKPETQCQLQMQIEVCKLLSMNTKKKELSEKKASSMPKETSLVESRIKKDLRNLKMTPKSNAETKRGAKLKRSQWSLGKEGWGSMRATEMTEERKQDLMVLNMRSTINPTQHYKHADVKIPKFFQIGVVQEDHFHHNDRVPKKKRKRTLVDELMADQQFKRKLKQQYQEVQATKATGKALFQGKAPRRIKRKK